MKRYKGTFITIEGPDGGGKSTHTKLVVKKLKMMGFNVLHTREPGGTKVSEKIRDILLDPDNRILPLTELLLYEAARHQHTVEIIKPALDEGKIVLCERYTDASTVYQGYGRKILLKTVIDLNNKATNGLAPDVTFVFDIDSKKGLSRARRLLKTKSGTVGGDRLERAGLEFHRRIRQGYHALCKKHPSRIKLISVDKKSIEDNQRIIMKSIMDVLKKKHI